MPGACANHVACATFDLRLDLFDFPTTEPNAEVGAIHPKAMTGILTTLDEIEQWMTAPAEEALKPQRRLADGVLKIVTRGEK